MQDSPTERWNSMAEYFTELAAREAWTHLTPMVDLCRWTGKQDFAKDLFPLPSLHCLCVHLKAGYNPDLPTFSCECYPESNQIGFQLTTNCENHLKSSQVPLPQLRDEFAHYVIHLLSLHETD